MQTCSSVVISYYVSLFFKQVHISKSASVADHCTSYALSDPNESVYQSPCDHQHNEVCDRCEMVGCEKYSKKSMGRSLHRVSTYHKGQEKSSPSR